MGPVSKYYLVISMFLWKTTLASSLVLLLAILGFICKVYGNYYCVSFL